MAFTVHLPGGTKDYEFEAYVRLLNRQGIDIGNIPRVLDPDTGNQWLYVWSDRNSAEEFAVAIRKETQNAGWCVLETAAQPSTGPLLPIEIAVGRRSDGCTYSLHPFSSRLIRKRFPEAKLVSSVFIGTDTKSDFEVTQGPILPEIAVILTGLSEEKLSQLGGYRVYDPVEHRVLKEATV